MNISIIIPNYNQGALLSRTLEAVKEQKYPSGWNVEIIVVDNASNDNSTDIAKQFNARLLINDRAKNPYVSRNMGIRHCNAEIIVFLDAACTPKADWLISGVSQITRGDADLVAGSFQLKFSNTPEPEEYAFALMFLDNEYYDSKQGAIPAGNFFVKNEVFDKIGLFNEIRSGSDSEWSIRARKSGISVSYAKRARVEYPSKRADSFYGDIKRMGKGARDNWKSVKGLFKTNLIALSYLAPMGIHTFQNKMKRRGMNISLKQTVKLWFTIWKARTIFAKSMLGIK